MNTSIITVDGVQYLLYVKTERKDGNVSCFSVLAFERVDSDHPGQRFLHEIIDPHMESVRHD